MNSLADRDEQWPYTKAEAAAIRDYFDPPSGRALSTARNAARNFADLYDPRTKKPNVRAQVELLGSALNDMRRALSMSAAAENHLRERRRTGSANDPVEIDRLHQLLHQFAYENRLGFQDLPPKTRAGRTENLLEKSLIIEFKQAFAAGHRGRAAKTGWPDFLKLCRDPLVRMRLLRALDEKSLQDKTRRRNRPKKAGN